jgi:hypothetical protein
LIIGSESNGYDDVVMGDAGGIDDARAENGSAGAIAEENCLMGSIGKLNEIPSDEDDDA